MVSSAGFGRFVQTALLGILLRTTPALADPAIAFDYCASINTASSAANSSIYQSDGLCHDFCLGKAALAVLHDQNCWCANYVPDPNKQVSIDKCDSPCPGFPSDLCGGNGLFGYIMVGKPLGTQGSGKTTSVTSSQTGGSTEMTTLAPTVQTVTIGGTTKTLTATPTVPVNQLGGTEQSGGSGLSSGAAAGLAVGVILAVAALIGVGTWVFLRRRRLRREQEEAATGSPRGSSSGPMSQTPRTDMSSNATTFVGGDYMTDANGKRRSRLMPIDPRMDPFGRGEMYGRESNKSHDSIVTIRDEHDYSRKVHEPSRVLRATNPDPDMD